MPSYLSDEHESLQNHAIRIIHPFIEYLGALELANLETGYDRRQAQTTKLFHEVSNKPENELHRFLPKLNKYNFKFRSAPAKGSCCSL